MTYRMPGLIKRPFKRRVSYQISLSQTEDPTTLTHVVHDLSSPFYAVKVYLMPKDLILVGITTNGRPWTDHLGRNIDEAFFERWRSPDIMLEEHSGAMNELRLKDNGALISLANDDRVEFRGRWRSTPGEKAHVALMGWIET